MAYCPPNDGGGDGDDADDTDTDTPRGTDHDAADDAAPYRGGGRANHDPRGDVDATPPATWRGRAPASAGRLANPETPAAEVVADAAAAAGHPQCTTCGTPATTAIATGETDEPLRPYCDDCSLAALSEGGREFGLPSLARCVGTDATWNRQATYSSWSTRDGDMVSLSPTTDAQDLGIAADSFATTRDFVSLDDHE